MRPPVIVFCFDMNSSTKWNGMRFISRATPSVFQEGALHNYLREIPVRSRTKTRRRRAFCAHRRGFKKSLVHVQRIKGQKAWNSSINRGRAAGKSLELKSGLVCLLTQKRRDALA